MTTIGFDVWRSLDNGCNPVLSQLEACTDNIHLLTTTPQQSTAEFLGFIYEQIDNLLTQCVTQSNSRSNTPVSAARQTPPIYGGKVASNPHRNGISQNVNITNLEGSDVSRQSNNRGKPRRVQLFTPADHPAPPGCPDVHRPHPTSNNDGFHAPHARGTRPLPSHVDFTPISSSTPSRGSQHRDITLADFVTPDRRKNRRSSRKQTPKSFASQSCGSWASGVGEGDITPLENGSFTSYRSHNQSRGVTSTEDCQPDENCPNNGIHSTISPDHPPSRRIGLTSPETSHISETSVSKPSRRITPTAVSGNSSWHGFKQQAVFTPQSPKKSQPAPAPGNFFAERMRLKERKAQIMLPIVETESPAGVLASTNLQTQATTPSKASLKRAIGELCIDPDPAMVTHKERIDSAAVMFSNLIIAGKTHNLTADLHLLVQLLCCQIGASNFTGDAAKKERLEDTLLGSLHNGVYFAVRVLDQCVVLQNVLDSSVMRLLSENDRLIKFNAKFAQLLHSRRSKDVYHSVNRSAFGSVSFQADTDNSKNFPSDKSFIIFKKQRDLFYEVKREWDNRHTEAGWSFRLSCSEKIFQLLNDGGVDVSNYVHLSRLFVNQLIVSCLRGTDEAWTEADNESVSLLSELKLTQPEKYRKLRERFIFPLINSPQLSKAAAFNGPETFFKSFIDIAKDVTFTQHLKDTLTLKLLNLNQTDFEGLTEQDCDIGAAVEHFSDCVLTSRLVAKFLGYLNFFPYFCEEKVTPALEEQYRVLRLSMVPPLDVKQIVSEAVLQGRCVIVIPWLVQYLSHVDHYSTSLPYYKDTLSILCSHFTKLKTLMKSTRYIVNIMLQYVCLSWLFNLSRFEDIYTTMERTSDIQICAANSIDSSPLASVQLVYACSEILRCIKGLLVEFVMGMKSKVSISRKITPLTAKAHSVQAPAKPLAENTANNLQQALEDSFFQNQQASLKKSVGFIADRVSSSYIKEFRVSHLASGLSENRLRLYNEAKNIPNCSNVKSALADMVSAESEKLCRTLHRQALAGVNTYFNKRIRSILELLLPSDTEGYIIDLCDGIIIRQGSQRVEKWLNTNLTLQYITAELNQEVVKYCRTAGKGGGPERVTENFAQLGFEHNEAAPSPTDTLLELQMFTGDLLTRPTKELRSDRLEAVIAQTLSCVTGRTDIVIIALKSMCHLVTLLLVTVAAHQSEKITPFAMDSCNRLWSIESLQSYWSEFVALVPTVERLNEDSDNLPERLYEYILHQRQLLAVDLVS